MQATKKIVLSKTIRLLGEILGNIIKEQEGISVFNKIEKIRALQQIGTALCCVYRLSICDTNIPMLEKSFHTYLPQ